MSQYAEDCDPDITPDGKYPQAAYLERFAEGERVLLLVRAPVPHHDPFAPGKVYTVTKAPKGAWLGEHTVAISDGQNEAMFPSRYLTRCPYPCTATLPATDDYDTIRFEGEGGFPQ